MVLAPHPKLKTYADYMKLPDYPRMELLAGELVMSPAPTMRHEIIRSDLVYALNRWVREHDLGMVFSAPCDVVFANHDLSQPDILYISKKNSYVITEKNIQGAPDFVLEIVSPGSEKRDRIEKKAQYEHFGVREYWIVDPKHETITGMILSGKRYKIQGIFNKEDTIKSNVIPGFKLHLRDIFKK